MSSSNRTLTVSSSDELAEAGTIIGDSRGYLYDEPRWPQAVWDGHQSTLADRLDGKNEPFYATEQDLSMMRGDSRLLAGENEVGIGAVLALGNYCFGTGFEYDYSAQKKKTGKKVSKKDQDLVEAVQKWNDEFDQRVRWRLLEREFHDRARVDGEPFLRFEPLPDGRADCWFVEPDAITEPIDAPAMDSYAGFYGANWKFGIATRVRPPLRPLGYFADLTGDQVDWDWIPEWLMVHGKRNVPMNCKRGMPDFFPVGSDLRRIDKILRNTGEGAAVQSAIAFIREHASGVTGSQVLAMGAGKQEAEISRVTPGGTTRTTTYQRYLPGTVLDVRAGQVYKPGPMGEGNIFVDVSQAIMRYVASRWNMPEFIISSHAGNTNFASILVAETPFVKSIEAEQVWFIEEMAECKWKMLGIAINAGKFAQYGVTTLAELKERVELEIKPPRVSIRNRLEETKIRDVLHTRGLISKQTWSAKEELNYEHEQAMLEEDPPMLVPPGAEGALGSAGLTAKGGARLTQPQAEEPGQNGKMPELNGRKK